MSYALVAPCSYDAARYAVERWHYSRAMPAAAPVRYGAWEHGEFIGAVVFGWGANPNLVRPFGLECTQGAELVRMAMLRHETPLSRIVSQAIRRIRVSNPGLRLLISFADSAQGHHGGVYQASNWTYLGTDGTRPYLRIHGVVVHPRTAHDRYGNTSMHWLRENVDPATEPVDMPPKYRYGYPLDRGMRKRLLAMAQPYPRPDDQKILRRMVRRGRESRNEH